MCSMMRLDFPWIAIPRQRRQLLSCRATDKPLKRPSRRLRQLPNGMDADFGEPRPGNWAHPPHQLDRQVMKEIQLGVGIDNHQPVGFGHLRGDLCQVFGARNADRDWKTNFCPDTTTYCFRNLGWRAEEMGATRNVSEGFVNGNPLYEGRKIIEHIDGGIAQPLVFLEMPADKDQLRTKLTSPPSRHTATNSKGLGFVRGCKHHPAADGDRFAAQGRVEQLLDRCIEGIKVGMEDGGCCLHPDRPPAKYGKRINRNRYKLSTPIAIMSPMTTSSPAEVPCASAPARSPLRLLRSIVRLRLPGMCSR